MPGFFYLRFALKKAMAKDKALIKANIEKIKREKDEKFQKMKSRSA
jgi:hypothetical protein